ncbi:hypothetical protein Tco_0980345, partial [Tanacetum coccineum]
DWLESLVFVPDVIMRFWLESLESLEGLEYNIAVLLFGESSDNRIMLEVRMLEFIDFNINDTRYEAGVIEFLDFAYRGRDESLAIP